jgi:DNA-directed RNA polymerase subunit L
VLQYLISKLEEHNYVYFTRTQSESITVEDIFWVHPTSVKLFNNFPTVLVMDSTYKIMYKTPMFEIVGVTSTDLTYSVGVGFVTHEKEENFVWVLQMMLKLLKSKINMPKVVVIDRDTTLMNVVATVLPESKAILCYFYVGKNVKAKCITDCRYVLGKKDRKEVKHGDVVKTIMRAWDVIVESPTQELYASALVEFQNVSNDFPKFLTYVESMILDVVKEKIVRAWT